MCLLNKHPGSVWSALVGPLLRSCFLEKQRLERKKRPFVSSALSLSLPHPFDLSIATRKISDKFRIQFPLVLCYYYLIIWCVCTHAHTCTVVPEEARSWCLDPLGARLRGSCKLVDVIGTKFRSFGRAARPLNL